MLNETFCYQANYTLRDCVSQCINNDTIQYANKTVIAADEGAIFIDGFQNVLEPMLDCEFVGEYASYIKEPLCTGMMYVLCRPHHPRTTPHTTLYRAAHSTTVHHTAPHRTALHQTTSHHTHTTATPLY